MPRNTTKKPFAKKTTVRFLQEDLDFLEKIQDEYSINQQDALRMVLILARCILIY